MYPPVLRRGLLALTLLATCTGRNPAYRNAPGPLPADADEPSLPADAHTAEPDLAAVAVPPDAAALPDAPSTDLAPSPNPDLPPPPPDASPDRPPPDAAPTTGLNGFYFDGNAFNTLKFQRVDPIVDFAWANDPPDPSLTFSGFSVRWTGKLKALYSEPYTFTVHSGDGSRLWIDGTLVIDDWRNHAPEDHSGMITLAANQLHDIKLEYLHNTGWSVVRLIWESPTQKRGVVGTQFFLPR